LIDSISESIGLVKSGSAVLIGFISKMIFSREMRAGRALLGWSQVELAKAASVGVATVRRLEAAGTELRGSAEAVWKIQKALEAAGVEFLPENETQGPGARLRRPVPRQKPRKKRNQ
jgi:transcriptional regulator with XRE-family HTH domain